jgi:glucose-1-phosphate adenylyltransferase
MGIYVFGPDLQMCDRTPTSARRSFRPRWRSVGSSPSRTTATGPTSARSRASTRPTDLTLPLPALNLYDPTYPIYTHARYLPGTKINQCSVSASILCEGSIITGARISDSIVGIRAVVQKGTVIERSIVMGANHFETIEEQERHDLPLGIGRDCLIRNSIVDFNARIGDGCRLVNEQKIIDADTENWSIRGGIIVVPKDASILRGRII